MNELLNKNYNHTVSYNFENIFPAKPFLKWAGGKGFLSSRLIKLFPNDYSSYYEPFIGGGALFFKISPWLKFAQISDLNKELILAYNIVKDDVESLIKELKKHEKNHSKEYYYFIREKNKIENEIKSTARLIYMNKTCFNGLYRVNSKGEFNVPFGRYKNPNICDEKNLRRVSVALQNWKIKNLSFEDVKPKKGSFIYCDPPYHDCFSNYQNDGFIEAYHILLAEYVKIWSKTCKVMISNSDTTVIRELYKDFHFHTVQTRRCINCKGNERKKQEKELVITTYEK